MTGQYVNELGYSFINIYFFWIKKKLNCNEKLQSLLIRRRQYMKWSILIIALALSFQQEINSTHIFLDTIPTESHTILQFSVF